MGGEYHVNQPDMFLLDVEHGWYRLVHMILSIVCRFRTKTRTDTHTHTHRDGHAYQSEAHGYSQVAYTGNIQQYFILSDN